jgi:hypothetical protein
MKKLLLSLWCSIALYTAPALADDFPYGQFSLNELKMSGYAKDATANALVLYEYGKTWISSNDGLPLYHEYHVKIKIFNAKGFEHGNISIPIYKSDNNSFEEVRDIEGITYYTDEQGNMQQTALDPKKVITENTNKYWSQVKFAMPNLRNGCIIEYKYTLQSPYSLQFKDWDFQGEIPKLYSEYEARIPAFFNFKASLRGHLKLSKNLGEIERECFNVRSNKCDCSKLIYAMSDVPAFVVEDHMTAPKNFIAAINFELNDYVDPYDGTKHVKSQTWDDIDRSLKQNDGFGSQLKKTGLLKEKITPVIAGLTNELAKAQAIYAFIQHSVKHNEFIGIYSDNGIRKMFDTHSGSVADINLGLVVALNAAGIKAEAVLLSTRAHGTINKLYPVVSDFNYVIAKANIGDQTYLLDATDAMLPFGLLPEQCLNDQGRVMSLNKPSYWIDLTTLQKWGKTMLLDLTLQTSGKLTGKITELSTGYEALRRRRAIKKFNSVEEYVENRDEQMPKVKILKSEIINLDTLEKSLVEVYDVEMNYYDNMNGGRIAFNPYLFNKITENPFKLTERSYPVDWGAATDTRVIMTLHLPDGYTVETPPAAVSVALPNQGGNFITEFAPRDDAFTFSHIMRLNKPIYYPEEYPYLKELFNKVIQTEKADIILKKKS